MADKPLTLKKPPKRKAETASATNETAAELIGKRDIKRSALEAWRKLDAVIQNELTAIQKGEKELNASIATAVVKFVEASVGLASGSDDLSPKDAEDKQKAFAEKVHAKLPFFDDDEDAINNDNNNQEREQQ
jgi:hypothetical protein